MAVETEGTVRIVDLTRELDFELVPTNLTVSEGGLSELEVAVSEGDPDGIESFLNGTGTNSIQLDLPDREPIVAEARGTRVYHAGQDRTVRFFFELRPTE